jgi:Rieske Fe-S protein
MNRRNVFRWGIHALRGLIALAIAVPGVAFVLTPLTRGKARAAKDEGGGVGADGFIPVARLADLEPGVPRSFPVSMERQDAWVKYPAEPVGTVWLVRQPEGTEPPVLALSAECPHLACQIKAAGDRKSFVCPCHDSHFKLDGERINKISPRGMDRLEVGPLDAKNPAAPILVKFLRFRTMTEEKTPLG